MTWETESLSDAPSGIHSNMDSDVLWSDDPELAYFRSLMNEQKDGASTMAGILDEQTLQTNEAPGASSGLTVAEDDTIARIDADDGTAKNWFAKQRSKPTHNIKMNTDDENKSNPYILAMQVITPVSAVSPHDRAANGRPNRPIMPNNYVRHNDNVVADSDADDNMTIPSTIFVTGGHPSAIQTKNGKGRSKRAGNKTPVKGKEKPSLHVDTSPRNTRTGPRSIFFWGKVFFVILLLAVLVAIIMLAIVFVQRGQDDGANSSQEGSFADDTTFRPVRGTDSAKRIAGKYPYFGSKSYQQIRY